MVALSPAQAAAMAAERRFHDNIWCGSEFYDLSGEDDCTISLPESSNKGCCSEVSRTAFGEHDMKEKSQKRRRESDDMYVHQSAGRKKKPSLIDLTKETSENHSVRSSDKMCPSKDYGKDLCGEARASSSLSNHDLMHESGPSTWQCTTCTLLNPVSSCVLIFSMSCFRYVFDSEIVTDLPSIFKLDNNIFNLQLKLPNLSLNFMEIVLKIPGIIL